MSVTENKHLNLITRSIKMAECSEIAVLTSELNKLKKNELIDLILTFKVPMSVTSDILVKYIKKLMVSDKQPVNNEKFHDSYSNLNYCVQCEGSLKKLDQIKCELDTMSKLTFHLEKRTQEQADLIALLKQFKDLNFETNNTPSCSKNSNSTLILNSSHRAQFGSTEDNKNLTKDNNSKDNNPQKNFNEVLKTNIPKQTIKESRYERSTNSEDKNRGNSLYKKRYNNKAIIGSNEIQNKQFKIVPRQGFLHLSRIGNEIKSDDVLNFLKKSAPDINFSCEEWHRNDRVSTYKVSFPMDKINQIYDPAIWPKGAEVRRFQFRQNFQKDTQVTVNI
ncbi:unnamed protein product [Psylliodes chrysocephalus]|uniref:Uncharacterized protein n=1 Tax=Psylliodes chrysocephalus TaxID=3402493 RepID=A0A9P0D2D0_9CUCU|nr:unnamed protein product [Psylliodes chrysocephala]